MKIKVLTGFLTGAAAILLLCWFLAPTADNELIKTVPVQVVPVAETGIQKNKEKPEQSLPPAAQQETTTEIPGKAAIISTIPQPPFPPALNAALDFVPTSPAGDEQNHAMPNSKKFFFWSPFSLNSKAKMFANYITSVSGVECGVEKTGAGRYQVYFPFEDESDRDEKSALIKGTGLKF